MSAPTTDLDPIYAAAYGLMQAEANEYGECPRQFDHYIRDVAPQDEPWFPVGPDLRERGLVEAQWSHSLPVLSGFPGPSADTPASEADRPPGRRPEREAEYRAAVFNDHDLSAMAAHAGAVIVHHCHSTMQLYASQKTLAEWMHLAPTSTKSVRSAVRELVEHGYLEPDGTASQGQYRYRLTIPDGVDDPKG